MRRRFPRRVTKRKRFPRRRRVNFQRRATIISSRFGTGFPDAINVKLKWKEGLNYQSSTLQEAYGYLRGNVPWDPDTRLGGKSALEFEKFAAVYRWCRCYGSKITAKAVDNNSNQSVIFALVPTARAVGLRFDELTSDKRARTSQFMTLNGMSRSQCTNFCTTKAIYGLRAPLNDNDHEYDHDCDLNTLPEFQWQWIIISTIPETTSAPWNFSLEVSITYYCRFFEKKPVTSVTVDDSDNPVILWGGQMDDTDNTHNPEATP